MHDWVLTNFARMKFPRTYEHFHPVKKVKPDVMNHLHSQTDVRWCKRYDRHCRLFSWSICISVCVVLWLYTAFRTFYPATPALWQISKTIFESLLSLTWFFPNQQIPRDFQVFRSCKHPTLLEHSVNKSTVKCSTSEASHKLATGIHGRVELELIKV